MDQLLTEKYQPARELHAKKPRILVAPLDWGLGHATRCIPLIRELIHLGAEVILGAEGAQEKILTAEFPKLTVLSLPGYRVRYAKTAAGLLWHMIRQGPRLKKMIREEHAWLKEKVKEHGLDAVISDNRYGLYHPDIPCIFITHQLNIKTSIGAWSEKLLQKIIYRHINRFTECWVPDQAGENNLAGALSHPAKKPGIPLRYIGPLSRFEYPLHDEEHERKDHLVILLSGPEPQRTILEDILVKQLGHYPGTATVVRGLPDQSSVIPSTNMLCFYNHLPSGELNKELMAADFVISRSGYSTIMDMVQLRKKSILVPTPGQTEQEYLATYLKEKQIAYTVAQKIFSLPDALQEARQFSYALPVPGEQSLLSQTIREFLSLVSNTGAS